MKKALILLGCPESPAQTPMAVYAAYKLSNMDYDVTIASNPAAMRLLDVSDPEEKYVKSKVDLESCLENLSEGDFDLLLGFVHRDAAVAFFVTFYHILNTKSIALIFEKDPILLDDFEKQVKDNTDAQLVSARAYHNPTPLKVRFDKALSNLEA
ncbi:DUF1890 domain-containing protein [Methanobacterium alcaliphilum]|uniref:DUF1890 domain-containing protein n=1 Tax=Methanobacterium alcaliphilum TaxID=392018 RepID=UPI00200A321C|nr:DUF1890 domain-containing protein [Methanobacterium alcaliphilum]MCK9150836.1 DUF1890 domain-containing protein [Methanobacterium alcaliphilum]